MSFNKNNRKLNHVEQVVFVLIRPIYCITGQVLLTALEQGTTR